MRRIVSFCLIFAIILNVTLWRPQKTDAVAITSATVVIAAVATILTACGINYWANSDDSAVTYLNDKLQDYLSSNNLPLDLLSWLGLSNTRHIFRVVSGGSLSYNSSVANKILAFARWLIGVEGLEPGGSPVEIGGSDVVYGAYQEQNLVGSVTYSMTSSNDIVLNFVSWGRLKDTAVTAYYSVGIPVVVQGKTIEVNLSAYDGAPGFNWALNRGDTPDQALKGIWGSGYYSRYPSTTTKTFGMYSSKFLIVRIDAPSKESRLNGSITIRVSNHDDLDFGSNDVIKLTPSSGLACPQDIDSGYALSVTTSAPILTGYNADDVAQSVLDTIASTNGLDASSATDVDVNSPPVAWVWLDSLIGDIGDILSDIYQTVIGIPSAIAQGVSDVLTGLSSAITAALQSAFVPSEAFIDSYVSTLYGSFDNHFSILSYPFSLLGEFITRVSTSSGSEPILSWGNIYEPFSGKLLIAEGSYNLNRALDDPQLRRVYDLYMILVKGLISFQFVAFLYSWFCDVFKMRNDDFADPIFDSGDPPDDSGDYYTADYY